MFSRPSAAEHRHGTGLVSAYITYIGEREPVNVRAIRNANPKRPLEASLLIGAGCLFLVHGDDKMATQLLKNVYGGMQKWVDPTQHFDRKLVMQARTLQRIADMLLARDDPDAAARFQRQLHKDATNDLGHLERQPLNQGRRRDALGVRTERGISSIATRQVATHALVVPALSHHDQGPVAANNYDLLVVDCGTYAHPDPSIHRAQVKHACLGFCSEEDLDARERGRQIRGQYMMDIALVSEHCDITVPAECDMGAMTKSLLAEVREHSGPLEKARLDRGTLQLLETIIKPEPWRMGTLPLAPIVPYAAGYSSRRAA